MLHVNEGAVLIKCPGQISCKLSPIIFLLLPEVKISCYKDMMEFDMDMDMADEKNQGKNTLFLYSYILIRTYLDKLKCCLLSGFIFLEQDKSSKSFTPIVGKVRIEIELKQLFNS